MIRAVDLFCGAGGFTAGLVAALRESGVADTDLELVAGTRAQPIGPESPSKKEVDVS